ncbi:MAG TPA: sugar ABC transporter permease [Acidimicrobiia bacterium]|nr:sugar ABC transporter permease [Acidimicrobiia bacterium]
MAEAVEARLEANRRPRWTIGRDLAVAVAVVVLIWLGLRVLRSETALEALGPLAGKLVQAVIGIVLGVVGIWALFVVGNSLVELLPARATTFVRPYLFVGPAIAVVSIFLVAPAIGTIIQSFTEVPEGEGPLYNYAQAFTDPALQVALRNNAIWLILAPAGSLLIGLAFAGLVDRVKRESLAKAFIFLPLCISGAGVAVIWRFIYEWRPPGQPQIGILNAFVTALGGEPVPWLQEIPVNTLALIVAFIWIQTGFAMVILSAAIKGVPIELMEAARIDGAGELQTFLRVVMPSIRGSVITVFTLSAIAVLKVFDIVYVTTNGNFQTDVIANRMFNEMFRFRNFGFATALAVILLVAVVPIIVINVRNLRRQGIGA